MDQAHLDQLLDPQTISRAEALGLQARHIVEGYSERANDYQFTSQRGAN